MFLKLLPSPPFAFPPMCSSATASPPGLTAALQHIGGGGGGKIITAQDAAPLPNSTTLAPLSISILEPLWLQKIWCPLKLLQKCYFRRNCSITVILQHRMLPPPLMPPPLPPKAYYVGNPLVAKIAVSIEIVAIFF